MQFQLIRYPEHYLLVAVTNPNSKKESRARVLRDSRQHFSGADSVKKFEVNMHSSGQGWKEKHHCYS